MLGRAFADHQHLVRYLAPFQFVDRIGKDIETLFHHQPTQKADDRFVIGDAQRLAPLQIAATGVENLAIHAARPDADIIVHPLVAEHLGHRFRRCHQSIAAAVQAPQYRFDNRLQKGQIVIAGVGFKPRMHRGQHRNILAARPRYHLVSDPVRAGYLHDIGIEALEIPAHIAGDTGREAIFTASGKSHRRHADQVTRGLEGRRVGGGRIDADGGALPQQIVDQPVEGLVGAVAHEIIIAAVQGNAKVTDFHRNLQA